MALLDFLNQSVGGYGQPSNLEGISESTQGAPRSNMTWGQLISAIGSLGNQGSQGNTLMSNPFAQGNQSSSINQGFNQSNVPFMQGSLSSFGIPDPSQDSQDINEIMQLISLFGGIPGLGAAGGALGPTTTMTGTGMFAG